MHGSYLTQSVFKIRKRIDPPIPKIKPWLQNLRRTNDADHASVMYGFLSVGQDLPWSTDVTNLKSLPPSVAEIWKANKKQNTGWSEVVRGHSRPSAIAPFNTAHTSFPLALHSKWPFIVTVSPSYTVSEI